MPAAHEYSIMEKADIVEELLRQPGTFEVHVLAHDDGDTVAQELLARHEDCRGRDPGGPRILALCFLNGGLFPEAHRASPIQRLLHRLLRYIPERRASRGRWFGAMQTTRIPLRLIDGAMDPVSGAHMAARYRELVPAADVVLLEGIGHYPQMEAPDETLRAYLAFAEGLPERIEAV
jgi:pimeloyl-ACP methyl ester carboxylesterase